MEKIAQGEQSQIYKFQKNDHAKQLAIRKISTENLENDGVHQNYSHLIKSRWLRQQSKLDKSTTEGKFGMQRAGTLSIKVGSCIYSTKIQLKLLDS